MQGFNMGRYIPPDAVDAGLISANQASGKGHALGARARKSHLGILTVRFEMPFAIWCSTCPESSNNRLIGQGVRFNAEKKRVGKYYSTPIWSFRMKHASCGGWMELRTDPKSSDFVVTEGARKRETGEDVGIGAQLKEEDEREKRRQDAFTALEVKIDDKRQAMNDASRIEELQSLKQRDWADPYTASRKLRREFRAGRKIREREAGRAEALQSKMGLDVHLVDENKGDSQRAGFVDFGIGISEQAIDAAMSATSKPLFGNAPLSQNAGNKTKKAEEAGRQALHLELAKNTRATMDPFLTDGKSSSTERKFQMLPGVRNKRLADRKGTKTEASKPESLPATDQDRNSRLDDDPGGGGHPNNSALLVNYESD